MAQQANGLAVRLMLALAAVVLGATLGMVGYTSGKADAKDMRELDARVRVLEQRWSGIETDVRWIRETMERERGRK